MNKVLILGVGNLLLSDEGLGIHAVEYMQKLGMPDYIDLLDGGTGGFHLLSLFEQYQKIIIIDATLDDNPTGNLKMVYPKFANDFPKALTTHDIGLKDLIDTAAALSFKPEVIVVAVTIKARQEIGMQLSPEIANMLPAIHQKVLEAAAYLNEKSISVDI